MKPESIMWLFPIMFMIHDFEEIIFMITWGKKYVSVLDERIPARLRKLSHSTLDLSTPAFAFAVMLIFITISIATLICVEYNLYAFWLAMVILYFVHAIIHIFQSLYLRIYIPAVVTSVFTGLYCVYAILHFLSLMHFYWQQVALSALAILLVSAVLFPLFIRSAQWLEYKINI